MASVSAEDLKHAVEEIRVVASQVSGVREDRLNAVADLLEGKLPESARAKDDTES